MVQGLSIYYYYFCNATLLNSSLFLLLKTLSVNFPAIFNLRFVANRFLMAVFAAANGNYYCQCRQYKNN